MDADSGLVRAVVGTAAKVNDVTQACALVDCEENDVFVDTGYQSVAKQGLQANWYVTMLPEQAQGVGQGHAELGHVLDKLEHVKVRCRILMENTVQLHTQALSTLWMAQHMLLQRAQG